MSTPAETKPADKPADPAAAAAAPPKSSAVGGILKLLIPAILAAGASYGGARAAAAHGPQAAPAPEPAHHSAAAVAEPGPTVALDPFLITITDNRGKGHVMKVSVAVEFDHLAKEEALKPFAPRIRDAILTYLRALTFEEAGDGARMEKLRTDMLERCTKAGASNAVRVLVTDFVLQ